MKADKKKTLRKLKIAKGQLDGIIKMIEDDRYCIDIYDQINATRALLASANQEILEAHMKSCVINAIQNDDISKIDEVLKSIARSIK